MCNRFAQYYSWGEIHELYGLAGTERNIEPRHNIAPATAIDTVISTSNRLQLVSMRWGLSSAWWTGSPQEVEVGVINARSEDVATRPALRAALKSRRCLIPASGFFAWKTGDEKEQPFYIGAIDGSVLTVAGLYEEGKAPNEEHLRSCTMIVTTANDFMTPFGNRMPVLLSPFQFLPWLSGSIGSEILRPALEGVLKAAPVSPKVNAVKNQGADLLVPVNLPAT
jgi:putative SOS response-associated peptidase YedK